MSDFSIYKSLEASRVAPNTDVANALAPVAQSHTRTDRARIANLSANAAEESVGQSKYRGNVISASITSNKAFVSNATDYTVVTVSKRTGSGAAVTVGTANLASVAGTAFVPIAVTLVSNSANTQVAAGDVLTYSHTITGNGVANNGAVMVDFVIEDT